MSETMRIWNSVCETDPSHTKRVNQRGGFTAIDAHYQVQLATEQFGPVGDGWGYDTVHGTIESGGKILSIVDLTLWGGSREQKFGPVRGCAEMFGTRVDTDAPKKAMTDALTKSLSHLGFNADVFLGKFDDNKYVAELIQKKNNIKMSIKLRMIIRLTRQTGLMSLLFRVLIKGP